MTLRPDEPLDGTLFGADQPCFGCGPVHPFGFHLRFVRDGDGVLTDFTPGDSYQGPPGIMHGGLVATLADEVAAWALVEGLGKFGFTTRFEGTYRRAIRIGVPLQARGRLTSEPRRLVDVAVTVHQQGALCFEGAFRFALLDKAAAEQLLGGPLPDAWLRFARDRREGA